MLRTWSIGVLTLSGLAVAAGCGVSASTTGLTPAFAEAAGDAHRYMTEHLLAAMGTSQFPRALAESRARVKTVRSKVSNDADKNLWLVLAMINVKSNEARSMYDLRNYMDRAPQVVQAASREVIGERDACLAEAQGWLSGTASKVPALKAAPCLQGARQAAAILGL